jgi:hypothetical protein
MDLTIFVREKESDPSNAALCGRQSRRGRQITRCLNLKILLFGGG